MVLLLAYFLGHPTDNVKNDVVFVVVFSLPLLLEEELLLLVDFDSDDRKGAVSSTWFSCCCCGGRRRREDRLDKICGLIILLVLNYCLSLLKEDLHGTDRKVLLWCAS